MKLMDLRGLGWFSTSTYSDFEFFTIIESLIMRKVDVAFPEARMLFCGALLRLAIRRRTGFLAMTGVGESIRIHSFKQNQRIQLLLLCSGNFHLGYPFLPCHRAPLLISRLVS
jgi:hypothetical protein